MPFLQRPPSLTFTVVPLDDGQPSFKAGCGHTIWRMERLVLHGKTVCKSNPNFSALPTGPDGYRAIIAPKQCILCQFAEPFAAAIECACCHHVIFRGDPVSAYFFTGETPPKGFDEARATRTRNGFVGCMGWECCPTSGFFAGHWTTEGILTPFSTGSLAAQALVEGNIVVSDIEALKG
ncbi:hypothetical protein HY631_01535 [Candidatus Uhrbacteria bacterium]|nr:hypothetical protein [Candidatus Uhrbacteria bacterium]